VDSKGTSNSAGFASCAILLKGMPRNFFLLPRKHMLDAQMKSETDVEVGTAAFVPRRPPLCLPGIGPSCRPRLQPPRWLRLPVKRSGLTSKVTMKHVREELMKWATQQRIKPANILSKPVRRKFVNTFSDGDEAVPAEAAYLKAMRRSCQCAGWTCGRVGRPEHALQVQLASTEGAVLKTDWSGRSFSRVFGGTHASAWRAPAFPNADEAVAPCREARQ